MFYFHICECIPVGLIKTYGRVKLTFRHFSEILWADRLRDFQLVAKPFFFSICGLKFKLSFIKNNWKVNAKLAQYYATVRKLPITADYVEALFVLLSTPLTTLWYLPGVLVPDNDHVDGKVAPYLQHCVPTSNHYLVYL